MPSAARRLIKELEMIKDAKHEFLANVEVDESNILSWEALLLPSWEPYRTGAFRLKIDFPKEYPFKAPIITFLTKIYHPNVGETGSICLNILDAKNWKPSLTIDKVVKSLADMINQPEPDHPLRGDVADEYTKKPEEFKKKAAEHTKEHAEKLPEGK